MQWNQMHQILEWTYRTYSVPIICHLILDRWWRWRSAVVTSFASALRRPLRALRARLLPLVPCCLAWRTCASSLRTDLRSTFAGPTTIEDMMSHTNINSINSISNNIVGVGARPSSFRVSPNRSVNSSTTDGLMVIRIHVPFDVVVGGESYCRAM